MRLISVLSATTSPDPGALLLVIVRDMEDGRPPEEVPFGYRFDDTLGLTPEVTAWFEAHPGFPVTDYAPPENP